MKNSILKLLQLIVTIIIALVLSGSNTVASEISPVASLPVVIGAVFPFLWWGIGLGVAAAVLVILYFIGTNMERKTTGEFETTIIDDIVSAIKTDYALSDKDLQELVAGIIATRRCSDPRLASLLRIEYEVEKSSASRVTRTTAVALKKQNDVILKKATRTMAWEDLPGAIRKEFILKNESVLVYSLFSSNEKEA
jgi:hypothetical protein